MPYNVHYQCSTNVVLSDVTTIKKYIYPNCDITCKYVIRPSGHYVVEMCDDNVLICRLPMNQNYFKRELTRFNRL